MPLKNLQIHHSYSSLSSSTHIHLAEKALTFLKRHPYHLNSLTTQFTPEAASNLLLKTQHDQTLILKLLEWAQPHQFFNSQCKCIALHILTKFKLYKTAQTLAQSLALETVDDKGNLVFQCLKDTYFLCNSSSAVFDLVVKSYSHLNFIDKALNIVALAKFNGFMPGVLSYNAILDSIIRCKKPIRFAEEVYKDMIESGVSLNVYSYNILIRGFCSAGNLETGLRLFKEMEKKGCLPNVVTFNTVIHGYCKLKRIDEAFGLLRSMGLNGLEPNLITYNMVINGLCKDGKMKETIEVLVEMSRKGYVPDEVTYNTLVNGYCKEGNIHQALVLHAEMVRNGLSPNVITYTSLISSMCKSGNLTRAMEFFDQMHVRGLCPNDRTYTTVINGFAQQGLLDEAYRVLGEMIRSGFSPSIVTYNALINGYCVLGRMDEAIGLLHDMAGKGVSPDVVSYSTIISGFARNQELDRAFQMKAEMVSKGVLADSVTYSSLIQGLCEQRRLDEACDLFQEMLTMRLPPDEFTYTTLIYAYCKEGDLKMAFRLHDEMIHKGFLPDAVTYNVLINGLNKQARTKEAKRLLLKLYYDESIPSDITYNTLIENCCSIEFKSAVALVKGFCMKGLMDEADRVFESMINKNHKPNEAIYNIIIHGHCRGGNIQKAYDLYNEMVRFGFVPHTVTVIALVKALSTEGMSEELNQVIGDILRSCKLTEAELTKVLVDINHKEGNMDAVLNMLTEMAEDGLIPSSGPPRNAMASG
ncbi:pentatricopeptide repeat-containing protein At5g39710 [Mercurialis annua]|uniref:pentatricopeptide repeat-containing protein At5g39710 n=1 Tax=Mercurialis annua TaxID=3986 RepID=UPI00215E94A2|nr:pentatricopeptide repeat-containing protein At5g39710 [Mercurialis annua]XP_050232021.1 pentatricopeptide repeat-containing protein At5g39710 [Mercurialis annua]XP_050232022.1 pentatricopeptide repeat-containing protein At5g39710 [Mercurialis annua]